MFWNNIQSGSAPRDGFLRLLKVSCCIRNVLADNGSRICFFLNKLQKKKTGKKNIWAAGCLRLPSVIQTDRWNILFCNFQKCQPKKKKKNYTSEFSIWLDVWQIFVFLEWKTKRPAASSKTGWGGVKKVWGSTERQIEVKITQNTHKIKKKKKKKKKSGSAQVLTWASNKTIQPTNRHGAKHPVRIWARRLSG